MKEFVKPVGEYTRDTDVVGNYQRDMATFLHKTHPQMPWDECLAFVRRQTGPGGALALKDPEVMVLVRQKNGDRKQVIGSLMGFLDEVRVEGDVLSPSMTSYLSPDKKESLLGKYVSGNLIKRSEAKHKKFDAEMATQQAEAAGDMATRAVQEAMTAVYEGLQTSLKVKNNSLSGAHVSEHTILYNKSSHSTLTSGCRAAASYGNTNNEKFIMGNRHYWCPDAVLANILSVINHTDLPGLSAVCQKYQLHYPSVEEVMDTITYSSDLYWRNPISLQSVRRLVEGLSPLERAAFVYVGDMYHLAKYNDAVVRDFIGQLASKATQPIEDMEVAQAWVKQADGDLVALVGLLCAKELDGGKIKDAKARPHDYGIIAATIRHLIESIQGYADLIRVLWVSDTMPASVALAPTIIRRCAITSDTDSTIFTVQHWTQWFVGKLDFTEQSNAVAAGVVYLASQSIRHILAQLSANMGVVARHLGMLQMKNEFMFPVFSLTSRAKHYYAYKSAQEGNVYKKMKTEIKGVALRNSAIPTDIMDKATAMMCNVMDDVMAGRGISYVEQLAYVADVENTIRASIEAGSFQYFSTTSIKNADSYKNPLSSNYLHYELWEEVFADKYGHTEAPPYTAVKVAVDADNPTKLKQWMAKMPDPAVAQKLKTWLEKRQRRELTMLLLPQSVLTTCGIPKEIICGINTRELICGLTEAFYLILESLGLYYRNNQLTRIASDTPWVA